MKTKEAVMKKVFVIMLVVTLLVVLSRSWMNRSCVPVEFNKDNRTIAFSTGDVIDCSSFSR